MALKICIENDIVLTKIAKEINLGRRRGTRGWVTQRKSIHLSTQQSEFEHNRGENFLFAIKSLHLMYDFDSSNN